MAKFLNKKERVIDFKLTSYGKQRLAAGRFKPSYYAFFDDGIVYDSQYAGFTEGQNQIDQRIKNETQFMESMLSFSDIEKFAPAGNYLDIASTDLLIDPADIDISPVNKPIKTNKFSYDAAISDIIFDSNDAQFAPATKIVTCQGQIVKIETKDTTNYDFNIEETVLPTHTGSISREYNIPQIDVNLYYTKVVGPPESALSADSIQETLNQTPPFADGNVIKLIKNDLVVYSEEMNTELLNENYDIEIYEILTGSSTIKLDRKYFKSTNEQIVDGLMIRESYEQPSLNQYTKEAVEYYFDVLTDGEIDAKIACSCASAFNVDSYYIDLDHDCEGIKIEEVYYDIYGSVTVPEICDPTQAGTKKFTPEFEEIDSDEPPCGDD